MASWKDVLVDVLKLTDEVKLLNSTTSRRRIRSSRAALPSMSPLTEDRGRQVEEIIERGLHGLPA